MLRAVLIATTAERQLQRNTSGETRSDTATRKSFPILAEALRGQAASHALLPAPARAFACPERRFLLSPSHSREFVRPPAHRRRGTQEGQPAAVSLVPRRVLRRNQYQHQEGSAQKNE